MLEDIILVNKDDAVVGFGPKLEVHQKELLHRAFSIFIYDRKKNAMLLQRRAKSKYHSGGLWTNACCSHPRRGETMVQSMQKRLNAELGLDIDIQIANPEKNTEQADRNSNTYNCGKFRYLAKFDTLSEHEIDHVYLLCVCKESIEDEIMYNHEEVDEIQWLELPELQQWYEHSPGDFTAWFGQAFELVQQLL